MNRPHVTARRTTHHGAVAVTPAHEGWDRFAQGQSAPPRAGHNAQDGTLPPRARHGARMPIYTYACSTCETRRDVRHSIHADPETTCPDCGGPVRRVIHAAGIAFKGNGFYKTDHLIAPPKKAKAPSPRR